MVPAWFVGAAVAYNVNLPDTPSNYHPGFDITISCVNWTDPGYRYKQTRLPDAVLDLGFVDQEPEKFFCENYGNMTWTIRRAKLPVTEDMIEGAGSTFRTPGCAHNGGMYLCPPSPCLLMEVDYQNYLQDVQALNGHTSCGAVFGRGALSNRYSGDVPPDPIMTGEDALFYPGAVRIRSDPTGENRDELSPLNPLSALTTVHPKYIDVPVPGYAPIDGLGALTAAYDFHRVGSVVQGKINGLFCNNANYLSNGSFGCTNISYYTQYSLSDVQKQDVYNNIVAQCETALISKQSYNGMIVFDIVNIKKPTAKVPITCYDCDPGNCVATRTLESKWQSPDAPQMVSLMRDRDLKLARNGKTAQNLPIYRASTVENEDTFTCLDGTTWTVPDAQRDCKDVDAPYPYPNHILSCGCYRYFKTQIASQAPPSPLCCKWVPRQLETKYSSSRSPYVHMETNQISELLNNLRNRDDQTNAMCPFLATEYTVDGTDNRIVISQQGCRLLDLSADQSVSEMTLVYIPANTSWVATNVTTSQKQYDVDPMSSRFVSPTRTLIPSDTPEAYGQRTPIPLFQDFVELGSTPLVSYVFEDEVAEPFADTLYPPIEATKLLRIYDTETTTVDDFKAYVILNFKAYAQEYGLTSQVNTTRVSPHHTLIYIKSCYAYYLYYPYNLSAVLLTPGAVCGSRDLPTVIQSPITDTTWIDIGQNFSAKLPLALIGLDAILQPCCPWYDWNLRQECADDPVCNTGLSQCTMSAADLNKMIDLFPDLITRCQAQTSTPPINSNDFLLNKVTKTSRDLKDSDYGNFRYTEPMNIPIDRSGEAWIGDATDWNDANFDSSKYKWGRVRKAYVVNPGPDPLDSIVLIVAESEDEHFRTQYGGNENGLRTWTVYIPGLSVSDPCQYYAELPLVTLTLDPVKTNAAGPASGATGTAIWNISINVAAPCKQNIDSACKTTSMSVSPAGIDTKADDFYTTDQTQSKSNVKLVVTKDTIQNDFLQIDPELVHYLWRFSAECATNPASCGTQPLDFTGDAASWAQQYIAATNAWYGDAVNTHYGSINFDLNGNVKNGENGEYCRWQFFDVRLLRADQTFDHSCNNESQWKIKYPDGTCKPAVFMPFTTPCNKHCDGEIIGQIVDSETMRKIPPCTKDALVAVRGLAASTHCFLPSTSLRKLSTLTMCDCFNLAWKGQATNSDQDWTGMCTDPGSGGPTATDNLEQYDDNLFLSRLLFPVLQDKDGSVQEVYFKIPDPHNFKTCISALDLPMTALIANQGRGGYGGDINNMYLANPMLQFTLDVTKVSTPIPGTKTLRDLDGFFAKDKFSNFYVLSGGGNRNANAALEFSPPSSGFQPNQAQTVVEDPERFLFVSKVLLFEHMFMIRENRTDKIMISPIPMGIGQEGSDYADIIFGRNANWNNPPYQYGQADKTLNFDDSPNKREYDAAFDFRRNPRFACQCSSANSARYPGYSRDDPANTNNNNNLHEDSTQQYNNAPHFYKQCCLFSVSSNDFDPPHFDQTFSDAKTLYDKDLFDSDVPDNLDDGIDVLNHNQAYWLTPFKPFWNFGSSDPGFTTYFDEDKELFPDGWQQADFNRSSVYRWVNHFDYFATSKDPPQCGRRPNPLNKPVADYDPNTRIRMGAPRGSSKPIQQFAITKVTIDSCTSKSTDPPPLAQERVASTNPTVPESYIRRPYVADIPNEPIPPACDCNGAKPIYACQVYSEVKAFEVLGDGPLLNRPFPDADPVICGWSFDDVPNGGVNIGLFLGSTTANIFVMERDPLGDRTPMTQVSDAKRFFLNEGAPNKEDLATLISNLGEQSDFSTEHRTAGDIATGYTSPNGKVTIIKAKGTCMRAPYGRVHRNLLSDADRSTYFQGTESNNGGLSAEADEAMYTYCEKDQGKFVFCANDGMTFAERTAWCNANPNNNIISLGYTIGLRNQQGGSPDMVCRRPTAAEPDVLCLYIPGDPVTTFMADVIEIAVNMDPTAAITILVAPFNYTALFNLQTKVRYARAGTGNGKSVFQGLTSTTWNDNKDPSNTAHGKYIDQNALAVIKNISSAHTAAEVSQALETIVAYFGTFTQSCPQGQQAGPVASFGEQRSNDYACYDSDTLVPHIPERSILINRPNVTIQAGVKATNGILVTPPTLESGLAQCSVFLVSEPFFKVVGPLNVDNTGCNSDVDHDRIPLRFFGSSVAGANVHIAPAPGSKASVPTAFTMLGYDPEKGVLSRKLLDVSGAQISVTPWPSFELNFAGALSRITGKASNLIDCPDANCTVMVQKASANDLDEITFGPTITIFDVSSIIDRFAHAEDKRLKRSNKRQEVLSAVWFGLASIVAVIAVWDFVNSPSTFRSLRQEMSGQLESSSTTESSDLSQSSGGRNRR